MVEEVQLLLLPEFMAILELMQPVAEVVGLYMFLLVIEQATVVPEL